MEFNERVVSARKAKNLSQEELAEAIGVSRQAVSKWETGEAKPDVDKLIMLCDLLDVGMNYLCLGKQEQKNQKGSPRLYLITAAAALIFLLLGMLIGALCFPREVPIVTDEYYGKALSEITITHAEVRNQDNSLKISIIPSLLPENLEVSLYIKSYVISGQSFPCYLKDDNYYYTSIPAYLGSDCTITAVFELNGQKKQVPFINVTSYGNNYHDTYYHVTHLWKE